eukprot:6482592-Prymnesium_polylepis.1
MTYTVAYNASRAGCCVSVARRGRGRERTTSRDRNSKYGFKGSLRETALEFSSSRTKSDTYNIRAALAASRPVP